MTSLIFTCEHGGNIIPEEYKAFFQSAEEALKSHRGWDIGILEVAKEVAAFFLVNLYYSEVSRLLIELNRSLDSPALFSEFTNNKAPSIKNELTNKYYLPYRTEVESQVSKEIKEGNRVIHISFHSFTPIFDGNVRQCDIGILFDPRRAFETKVSTSVKENLETDFKQFITKFNYPYQGVEDGFTTHLRTKFKDEEYCGIELELNQKHLLKHDDRETMKQVLIKGLKAVFNKP